MKEEFKARDYNEALVNDCIQKATSKNRKELLHPRPKEKGKTPLTLVTTFNKALPNLKNIMDKNWNLLGINKDVSRKFNTKPLIAYRRNPNLQQLVGGHRIENGKVVKRKTLSKGSCSPCRSKEGNKCCKQMRTTTTFQNRHTNTVFKIFHRVNCKDKNIIYLLECIKCNNKGYVGKSEIAANLRMNGHRSDAKKQDKLAVDARFLQPGHDFQRDAKFTIIE